MMPKKPKACSSNWNIKNFKHWSQNEMYWFKKIEWYYVYGAKWKASKLCNQILWEVIYVYFYNWDWSLFLVLIMYVFVELINEASHYTKDYLIFGTDTHHTCLCSMNALFICVIVLDYMCCTCSIICWSNTKIFLRVLIVFGKLFSFVKISKTMQLCSDDSISRVNPIACLQSQAYSEASATLWQVRHPVTEKT